LIHHAAHIAERKKNTSTTQINIKNPRFQCFEYGIELFGLGVTLLGSFDKIFAPGNIQIAGDIRRIV